jgi:hypothetical protein
MSIYTEELVAELEGILEYTEILLAKFDAGVAARNLLLDVGTLKNRLEGANRLMPEGITIEWGRKLHFLNYYLKEGSPTSCRGDVVELSTLILPAAITQVKELGSASAFLDAELRATVLPLIRVQQFN